MAAIESGLEVVPGSMVPGGVAQRKPEAGLEPVVDADYTKFIIPQSQAYPTQAYPTQAYQAQAYPPQPPFEERAIKDEVHEVPRPTEKRICGLRRTTFWLAFALAFVILAGALGGGLAGGLKKSDQ
jgi:hypothetical protein